ncbi:MAG: transposase [Sphingomonadales bacterium]|nr:transposase [Sphingomonadales bacterium]
MPQVLTVIDDRAISLAECTDAIAATGFDPLDEASLAHAALQLRRLGNNRAFLGDILVDELANRHREESDSESYGPQVIMLSRPGEGFFLRANLWPSESDHMYRASGRTPFAFDLPHDHNFHFLTHGYFGPGYWSDYYEFDYEAVTGWRGEPVDLRFVERARLEPGKIMLYRAHVDVHSQLPADALSVSVNVMHTSGAQGWLDQYRFDTGAGCIAALIGQGASEAFIRIAVGLGHAEAIDLARRFGQRHPSDRMRLCAYESLASIAPDFGARDAVWREAEGAGSRLVAAEARQRRTELV